MYDYKIVEQATRKKKKLSGALKKTMVFFAVVFVVMGITISQAFMLAGFCRQKYTFSYQGFPQIRYTFLFNIDFIPIQIKALATNSLQPQ